MSSTRKIAAALTASVAVVGIATVAWAAGASTSPTPRLLVASNAQVARPDAFIDTSTETRFTPTPPCRIADTRVAGGKLTVGTTRAFQVTGTTGFTAEGGTSAGCNVPANATAIAATVVAVDEAGPGFLIGWAKGGTQPGSSFANYANTNLVSTGVTLPINSQLDIVAGVNATDVVIDIDGYYIKPMYADVNSNGTLANGSRVTSSSAVGTGEYEVDFDRNVSHCAYAASPSAGDDTIVVQPSGTPDEVFVETAYKDTLISNTSFSLTVTC